MRAEPFRVGLGRVGWVTIRSILGQIRSDSVRFGNLQDRSACHGVYAGVWVCGCACDKTKTKHHTDLKLGTILSSTVCRSLLILGSRGQGSGAKNFQLLVPIYVHVTDAATKFILCAIILVRATL